MVTFVLSLVLAFYGQESDALMAAAERGDAGEVAIALRDGARADAQDDDGQTALITASAKGHREVVRVLLAAGADVDTVADNGWSAVVFAEAGGHTQVVDLLLEEGARWPTNPPRVQASGAKTEPWEEEGWTSEPVLLHKPPAPKYPSRARNEEISGEVILHIKVLTDGTTEVVGTIKPLLHCTRAAMKNARQWRWKPAEKDGVPVEADGIVTVTFDVFSVPGPR